MALEKLHDVHARERAQRFVGRQRELTAVDQWLAAAPGPTCVFSVTGMGGIGKSTLLARILDRARRAQVNGFWIDGRACPRTPAGFLSYVETAVLEPPPGRLPLGFPRGRAARLVAAAGPRAVWCIDDYDELEPLDGWFREGFLAELPAVGHLVVLASRRPLSAGWQGDPFWRQRLHPFPLAPLSRTEARDYLRRAGVSASRVEDLVRQTGGLPLALSLAADACTRRAEGDMGLEAVSAHLLREVAGEELGRVLDVLACVPEADAELLRRALGKPVPLQQLAALARLSFVEPTAAGFRVHEVARRYLLGELRQRDPGQFRRVRRRIVAALLERWGGGGSRSQRASVAASLLSVCADALPSVESYAALSAAATGPIRSARPEDVPALVELLGGWGRQPFLFRDPAAYGRLVECMVERFPEWCRILEDSDGRAAGFLAAMLLSRETVACLDAIEPGALRRQLPGEYQQFAAVPPEQADTYLALMVGLELQNEEYTWQEVVGLLIRDGLAQLGDGTRALVRGTHPGLVRLLSDLGFAPYHAENKEDRGAPPPPGEGGDLYVLDLRGDRFGPWVVSLLEAMESHGDDLLARTLVPIPELRRLLTLLHDPEPWRQSPLPAALGWEPDELRAWLRRLLAGAEPLPAPLSDYDRQLLETVAGRNASPEAWAARLHVSRATYYRHLARALEHLHQALADPLACHSPRANSRLHDSSPR